MTTLLGVLVLLCWIPSVAFLYYHGRTRWWRRPAGQSVFVMALVVTTVLTLSLFRLTIGNELDDELRAIAYILIMFALWWQLITILRYVYGNAGNASTATLNPGTRQGDREETR